MTRRTDNADEALQPDAERLDALRRQLSGLKSQAQQAQQAQQARDELRNNIGAQVSRLERLGDETANRLDELRDAGHHAVAELRAGIELAIEDLEAGLRTLRHKLDDSGDS